MRLDIANPDTVEKLDGNIVAEYAETNAPLDVCRNCYDLGDFTDDVDHPPYDDGIKYTCAICGSVLDEYIDR